MKSLLTFLAPALLLLATPVAKSAPIRVACVGDSITAGYALAHPERDAFPAQLSRLFGAGWEVRNFGVSGATLMNAGNKPYVRQHAYGAALAWKPEVVVIALGTNDTKDVNIGHHPDNFVPSYHALIAAFRRSNPKARIFLCIPPPAFPAAMGISNQVLVDRIIPLIRQVAAAEKLPIIDLYDPLKSDGSHFHDRIHPDPVAAGKIAAIIHQRLIQSIRPASGAAVPSAAVRSVSRHD